MALRHSVCFARGADTLVGETLDLGTSAYLPSDWLSRATGGRAVARVFPTVVSGISSQALDSAAKNVGAIIAGTWDILCRFGCDVGGRLKLGLLFDSRTRSGQCPPSPSTKKDGEPINGANPRRLSLTLF